MDSWLIKIIRKLSKQDYGKGTPGSPGGGELGTPVLPDSQIDLFIPDKTNPKKRRTRHDDKKKQSHRPAGRSWNDTAQMQ